MTVYCNIALKVQFISAQWQRLGSIVSLCLLSHCKCRLKFHLDFQPAVPYMLVCTQGFAIGLNLFATSWRNPIWNVKCIFETVCLSVIYENLSLVGTKSERFGEANQSRRNINIIIINNDKNLCKSIKSASSVF